MTRAVGGGAAFVLLAAGITTAVLVAGGSTPAGATELARFASCEEIAAWSVDAVPPDTTVGGDLDDSGGGDVPVASPAAPTAGRASEESGDGAAAADTEGGGTGGPAADTGGTNTVVEGVDEIDIVDRLPGDRALVVRNSTLSLVDLAGMAVLDSVEGVSWDSRISVADDLVWIAGTRDDGLGVSVSRWRLAGDGLEADGEWTTPGYLIDARRTGDTLHVVAVDQPQVVGAIPFEDGPVPCDQVWHPEAGADTPAATLVVNLPAEGPLEPTAAAEVVGSGAGFHVTATAAYVTTQTWAEEVTTGVHRFDLATLAPTGSGSVPGSVPGPFGLSEHEGHLRVATSAPSTFVGGREGVATDIAVDPAQVPPEQQGGPLAEVFVLDLDGALDVVGSTGRFGHDGETIQGVRFVGDTAYVVTFLQTDPFWVVDLGDPAAPTVVGELEIPGFSAYLHPVDDGHVVGFGPTGDGSMSARLFNVADPAAPSLLDEVELGDDSPVAWDYHAYVALDGGRFAVPYTEWPDVVEERCGPAPTPVPLPEPIPVDPGIGGGTSGSPGVVEPSQPLPPEEICEPIFGGGATGVRVLTVDGDDLVEADEASVETDGSFTAERVLPTAAGSWVFVGWDRLVAEDGTELVLPMDQSAGGDQIVVD